MASPKNICTSCLRTLRHQPRPQQPHPSRTLRPFSSSRSTRAAANDQHSPSSKPPPPRQRASQQQADPIANFAASLRNNASSPFKSTTEPYIAYGSTEDLFAACAAQCDYSIPSRQLSPPQPPPKSAAGEDLGEGSGWWFAPKKSNDVPGAPGGGLALEVTFNNWAQVTMLHMYMLTVRLRAFPPQHAKIWHQNLLDHFFYAAEDRMATLHNMTARSVRNGYLKQLYEQWRGLVFSYDEGLVRGDAVLAAAVWRNVFQGRVGVEVRDVAVVVGYLRQELSRLAETGDERIGAGDVRFGDVSGVEEMLRMGSKGLREPFAAADEGVRDAVVEAAVGAKGA